MAELAAKYRDRAKERRDDSGRKKVDGFVEKSISIITIASQDLRLQVFATKNPRVAQILQDIEQLLLTSSHFLMLPREGRE